MCGALSNTFFQSKNATHTSSPLSKWVCQSFIAVTKAPVVDLPFRKLNWELDNIGSVDIVEHRCFKNSECTCLSSTLLRIGNSDIGR